MTPITPRRITYFQFRASSANIWDRSCYLPALLIEERLTPSTSPHFSTSRKDVRVSCLTRRKWLEITDADEGSLSRNVNAHLLANMCPRLDHRLSWTDLYSRKCITLMKIFIKRLVSWVEEHGKTTSIRCTPCDLARILSH